MSLPAEQLVGFKQLMTLGLDRATGELNEMVAPAVHWQLLQLICLCPEDLTLIRQNGNETLLATVRLAFRGATQGSLALAMLPAEAATLLARLLGHEDSAAAVWDTGSLGMFSEIGSVLVNAIMGTITTVLRQRFTYTFHPCHEASFVDVCNAISSADVALVAQLCCVVKGASSVGHLVMLLPKITHASLASALVTAAWHEAEIL